MRLTLKLSLLLSGLALAVLASAAVPLYWSGERHLLDQLDSRQVADLQQFGRVCGESVRDGDPIPPLGYLRTLILFADQGTIAFALFADAEGRILLHSDVLHGDQTQRGRLVSGPAMARALSAPEGLRQTIRPPSGPAELLSAPVYDGAAPDRGRRVGTAFIAYDQGALEARVKRLQRESLVRVLEASWRSLALGFLLAALMGSALIRPIESLRAGARRIGGGRLDTRLAEDRKDELGDLAREFNAMAAKLAEVDELKDSFLAQITHDLRSPLSAIVACVDALSMGAIGKVTPEQSNCLGVAASSAEYLSSLIEDMLDVTRLEAGRMEFSFQPVDLAQLAREVVGLLGPKAEEYRVQLDASGVGEDTVVAADERALRRVLVNLVSNALKFTPSGGEVRVACRRELSFDRVSVSDTGIGIPPDKAGTLFQKFVQVAETKNKVREARGTGLGLVICKQIVEAHGGAVGVESVYRRGSTFYFTLPRRDLPAGADRKPAL